MGHANSKQKIEVEKILSEVKDIHSYINKNSQDFDDESKDNIHKRLIGCSNILQDLNKSTKDRHSKELKDALKYISKVTEELLQENPIPQHLDQGAVETNSFVHIPAKNSKSSSVESLTKKQSKPKKEIINFDKYRLPSLKEIQNKTISLKSDVENSVMNEDINQMLVQQKIIQILATDLEMIIFEPHSTLHETKTALEKDLSLLYRKIEKNKNKIQRRNSELVHSKKQKDIKENLGELSNMSNKIDQIMSQAHTVIREKKFTELCDLKDNLLGYKSKMENMSIENEEVRKQKVEVEQKVTEISDYLTKEMNNHENIERKKFGDDMTKIEMLIDKYKADIIKFDKYTDESMYSIYKKNLDDLENIISELPCFDNISQERKNKSIDNIKECRNINEQRLIDYNHENKEPNNKEGENENRSADNNFEKSVNNSKVSTDEEIVLRTKKQTDNKMLNEARSIDGFYSYWKEIKTNSPAANCSLEELKQISLILYDIENQIHSKRCKIDNFLDLKKNGRQFNSVEEYRSQFEINKRIIDEIDSNAIKTNAKIYNLDKPKVLVISDEEIIQNINEINEQMKNITKQEPEKVVLAPDSTSESSYNSRENEKSLSIPHQGSDNIDNNIPENSSQQDTHKIKLKSTKHSNNKNHVENITQIQNISRDVDYLREKAMNFSGRKQTPKYAEIKSKLDSFRKTLNVLISYQNENITLACNRVLQSIDEVVAILNSNTEKEIMEPLKNTTKRNTIETLFVELMDIKADIDDLSKKIENFDGTEDNEEYVDIKNALLKYQEALNNMKITSNYDIITNSRAEVLKQINEGLYNLNFKIEENKIMNRIFMYKNDETTGKIMVDLQRIKDKINRFSGSYKNVLYREIEKSTEAFLSKARGMTHDKEFLETLEDDAAKYLKILEQKSSKESNYDTSTTKEQTMEFLRRELENCNENESADNAIRLSRIRQNLKDITEELNSPKKQTLEHNQQLDHRINLNILELSSMNIMLNEPFYYDKDTLRSEFLKLSSVVKDNIEGIQGGSKQNQESHDTPNMMEKKDDAANELYKLEQTLGALKKDIDSFSGERNSDRFFNIDESLTKLSMTVEFIPVKKGSDLHKKKRVLLKKIYQYCVVLENKAQSYELLQNIEKRITEVTYRVNSFEDLSDGDYNALYRELVDLDMALKDLNIGDDIMYKKVACQTNIHQCLGLIEDRMRKRDNDEHESDDGTLV